MKHSLSTSYRATYKRSQYRLCRAENLGKRYLFSWATCDPNASTKSRTCAIQPGRRGSGSLLRRSIVGYREGRLATMEVWAEPLPPCVGKA